MRFRFFQRRCPLALRAYVDQFWTQALAAFKTAAEQDPEEDS